ncbi:MBG domain-containing protein [Candidatus Merdisoma sp. JLR.KK006]|uniref:MBG domain-containing protein n=1 Tax=Candidatus Merdisoma sp. JLR.KK006 TaxID=3112626 RepID=UPI002FF1FB2E
MMKKWKCRLKSVFLAVLTAALVTGGTNYWTLAAMAAGRTGSSDYETAGGENLTADEKRIYNALKSAAKGIAAGKRISTIVNMSGFTSLWNSSEEITEMLDGIMSDLLQDYPGDFYWYGKEYYGEWPVEDDGKVRSMTVSLAVLPEYQDSDLYTIDTQKAKAAQKSAENAQAIVEKYEKASDYKKLKGYVKEINNLVSYDESIYDDDSVSCEAPWQFIWVFDGDRNTNAAYEGYADAFQYLCDMSEFQNAACYTVEGAVSGGVGEGSYMWNIVTLEGNNYLVDVANCSTQAVGAPDQLFLAGTEGSARDGYTFSLNQGKDAITYEYGRGQSGIFGDILELSPYQYQDPDKLKLTVTPPTAEVTFGDAVDNGALIGGSAVNEKKEAVSGTFTWADGVTFYGNAGTNTLQAVFTPENPQYPPVEDVSVRVKVNRRPVTVQAEAKSKTYGDPDPEWTYTYSNVIEGYPLSGRLARTSGEEVGTYSILQGTLTDTENPNYTIVFTGNNLKINPGDRSALQFMAGNERASAANAVTIKTDAVYGDSWSEIVRIGSITAKLGAGSDSAPGHFTLQESGTPGVGSGQRFHVLYNGTIGGHTYTNELVCEGTVDVKKRVVTVSEGSYKVSKTYDRTRSGGTASGQLVLNNVLAEDANRLDVKAVPEGYTDPNVNGQQRMTANLTLSGAAANNYELGSNQMEVPCEILPQTITPAMKVSGNYSYTGRAVVPTVTVANGTDVLEASDYELSVSNNRNAGTGRVAARPRSGGNYTWSSAVEASFTIDKAEYKGTKTGSTSMESGGTAVFSLFSMLPEGYKLGDIRVSDPDKIFAETPTIAKTVLSCKLTDDEGKEGKSAVVTVPVTETANYLAYDLNFTVTMASQHSGTANPPASSGNQTGTAKDPAEPPKSTSGIQADQLPAGDDSIDEETPNSANVTPLGRQNTKSGRTGGIGAGPVVWCLVGAAVAAGAFGSVYFVRRKQKTKPEE